MDGDRWTRIQAIFHEVVDTPPGERTTRLRQACEGDPDLEAAVRRMLEADAGADPIIDSGIDGVAGELLDEPLTDGQPHGQFGPYRLVRPLGEGGMGVVHLAVRDDLGQTAAIKVLRDVWVSPEARERFVREQRTLARLSHPSIARLYHAGTLDDGTPWLAMEYVDGLSLMQYCARHESGLAGRLRLFRQVCDAVQHAHQQLVVHRDLKPSNILVTSGESVKLLDFGIARQLDSLDAPPDRTRTVFRFLTPNYAAPEQLSGAPSGIAADVYSLGVILYELLTGRRPFELADVSPREAETIVAAREPSRPSALVRTGGVRRWARARWDDLDVICLTAMHKDPARRYRSVEALARDVEHYERGEPLEARPDTWTYRAARYAGRNARVLAAAAVVLLVAALLVTFYTLRLSTARAAAEAEASRAERIQEFMLGLFDAGERDAAPRADLRVVALVDRGLQEARSLEGQPLIQAALFHTLGLLHQRLGSYDRAEASLQAAIDRRRELLGEDHADTLDSLIALGLLRIDQARLDEAEQLVRDALARSRQVLPEGHRGRARATAALGRVLEERGAYDEAIPALQRAVQLYSAGGQPPGTELAGALSSLANARFYRGELDESERLNQRVLAMNRELRGERHASVASDLLNLGAIATSRSRHDEAVGHYQEALAIMLDWYGPDHPQTASAQTILAQGFLALGRYDEASGLLQRALETQERVYGPVHRRVGFVLNEIGLLARRQGRLDEAEAALDRSLAINRELYPEPHFRVGVALANLGSVYLAKGQPARAERLFREALNLYHDALPRGHTSTGIAAIRLGSALVAQGRYQEAETHLVLGRDIMASQDPPWENWLQPAREELVRVYEALGDGDRARAVRAALEAPADDDGPDRD
jgi:eukaryotic-like serine/threonine-protein kinase